MNNNFENEKKNRIEQLLEEKKLIELGGKFIKESTKPKYSYNFNWLGRPIIQYPQDIVAMQELIWQVNPDLIIETGIAHGGSLIFTSSMLTLLEQAEQKKQNSSLANVNRRMVIGVDIEIREHNRQAIENHPFSDKIHLIQGSSIDPSIVKEIKDIAAKYKRVMVILDSNHTHKHVLEELENYAPLTSIGSYCVVFDTIIERLGEDMYPDRPWGPGNNPHTAVIEYLSKHTEFEIDKSIPQKLVITVAPDGYIKRIR